LKNKGAQRASSTQKKDRKSLLSRKKRSSKDFDPLLERRASGPWRGSLQRDGGDRLKGPEIELGGNHRERIMV